MSPRSRARATLFALTAALGAVASLLWAAEAPAPIAAALRVLAWVQLMILPGLGLTLWVQRSRREAADVALSAFAVSPPLLAGIASLSFAAGLDARVFLGAVILAAALLLLTAPRAQSGATVFPPGREVWVFAALLAAAIVLVATLPATREWWRIRSDAWFHAAVTLEMRDNGAPPEDPYFAGVSLQYMWAYHALVLALGRALHLDYFWVMALVNWHAVTLLALAAYRLAAAFRTGTAHRIAAVATTLFGFNAAFWIFLPIKATRALVGDVRGIPELTRTFALAPVNYLASYDFVSIFGSAPFFLDKYMVATAFGVAIAYQLAALAAACVYLSRPGRGALLILWAAVAGTLLFHTYVGLVTVLATLGALAALLFFRKRVRGYTTPMSILPAVTVALAIAVTAPFVYEVTRIKDSGGVSLLGLSLHRALAILIPCAFVMVVAWRGRTLRTGDTPAMRYFQYFALMTLLACLVIRLPGANDNAKPPFPVFVSLAVAAGIAIADSCMARTGRARGVAVALWIALFALPVNALALAGCWRTKGETVVTAREREVAGWAAANTARNDVFIDEPGRVFLLVAGPRRYLFGSWDYASQWKYPRAEMARRYHTVRALFAPAPLDSTALGLLAAAPEPLFVIVRPEHHGTGAAVEGRDDLFPLVFQAGDIRVRAVDRAACARARAGAPPGPTEMELIRASGL